MENEVARECGLCGRNDFKDQRQYGYHQWVEHGIRSERPPTYKRLYEPEADGKFTCPDCPERFAKALELGTHRGKVHGYISPNLKMRMARRKQAAQKKPASMEIILAPQPMKGSSIDDSTAIYLYGRIEREVQEYGERNNLSPSEIRELSGKIGNYLVAAAG